MNPAFLLMNLALKARANATELRLAAYSAQKNAEALEDLICNGSEAELTAAVNALAKYTIEPEGRS